MTRAVLCSRCGETVRELVYETLPQYFDGTEDTCPGCDAEGVIQVDADEDGVRVVFQAEDKDTSPNCRCEECPMGGPYTCIDASGWD